MKLAKLMKYSIGGGVILISLAAGTAQHLIYSKMAALKILPGLSSIMDLDGCLWTQALM
jgi:hypothetical protein